MQLTTSGIIFVILGWGIIFVLTVYSFGKVLKIEAKKKRNGA